MTPPALPPVIAGLVERGILTAAQVEACRAADGPAAPARDLAAWLEALVERGYLDRAELVALSLAPPASVPATAIVGNLAPPPPPADATSPAPGALAGLATALKAAGLDDGLPPTGTTAAGGAGRRIGPFELLAELGRGGMGVVYRARDTRLDRIVALKGILGGRTRLHDPEGDRLLREARAAARLHHPGIVAVHEIAEIDGEAFLAMEFVDGDTLSAHRPRAGSEQPLHLREGAELVRQVAQAVAYAHAEGVIHRDLKPDNVLVDRAGRARVGDFGLAKDLRPEASHHTATGAVMGTPSYMAPEQARGKVATRSTDVYGLGGILYYVLTGQPPHEASSFLETLYQVGHAEPARPSTLDPRVPRDLDVICLKCLEKDPHRRYASAGEVADELSRFLAGEAIRARPASPAHRAYRWVSRRKALVAALGAVLLASSVAAAAGVRAWREAEERRQSVLEGEFYRRTQVRIVQALERRRLGENRALGEVLDEAVRKADEELARRPDSPSAHFVKGWLLRIAERWTEAEAALSAALARKPDDEPSRYERGLARSRLYQRAADAARARWAVHAASAGEPAREPGTEVLEALDPELATLRARVEDDFAALATRAAQGTALELPPGGIDCGRALLALYRGDFDEARRRLDAAFEQDAYREEFWEARIGLELRRQAQGLSSDEDSLAVLDAAIERNGGRPDFFVRRAERRSALAGTRWRAGQPEEALALWARAHEDAAAARALDRDGISPWSVQTQILTAEAEARRERGDDVRGLLQRAVESATADLSSFPNNTNALTFRGRAFEILARVLRLRGEESRSELARAQADLDRVVELDPENSAAWCNRGLVHWERAEACTARDEDPRPDLNAAIADFDQAILRAPPAFSASYRNNRAIARRLVGRAQAAAGADPRATIAQALADLDEAIRAAPADPRGFHNRAMVHATAADLEAARGVDPRPSFDRALRDLDEALRLGPGDRSTLQDRAQVGLSRARAERDRGGDPRDALRRAQADADALIRLAPPGPDPWVTRGMIERERALADAARGIDATEGTARAIADFEKALERRAGYPLALLHRGTARSALAELAAGRGQDAGELHRLALEDLAEAVRLEPTRNSVRVERGNANVAYARFMRRRGQDARPALRHALEDFDAVLARDPRWADAAYGRGTACHRMAVEESADAVCALGWLARALRFYDDALEARPGFWQAHVGRGIVFESFQMWPASLAAYETGYREQGETPDLKKYRAEIAAAAAATRDAVPLLRQLLDDATAARAAGDPGRAAAGYDGALSVLEAQARAAPPAERAGKPLDPALAAAMADAHLQRARCLANLSARSEPEPAAEHRRNALRHLRKLRETNAVERARLEEDPELAPLLADPGWESAVR